MDDQAKPPAETFPCDECGGLVDLSRTILVKDEEGYEALMPEYAARQLLRDLGIPTPPVMCDKHERMKIVVTADV